MIAFYESPLRAVLATVVVLAAACTERQPVTVTAGAARPEAPIEATVPGAAMASPVDAHVTALAERADQGDAAAVAELKSIAHDAAGTARGDQAALVVGVLELHAGRAAAALEPLRQAAAGAVLPDYARLLFARAVVEGSLDTAALDEARRLLEPVPARADTPALRQEAMLRLLQVASRSGDWSAAAAAGERLLQMAGPGGADDEARWLTAESLRLAGDTAAALDLDRAIWLETPGSPWATRAHQRLQEAGVEVAPPPERRLAWVEQLQRYGLHRDALAALEPLLEPAAPAVLRDRAAFLAAVSHYLLRENDATVRLAEELRRRSPESTWAARAALQAMRALGRDERTEALQRWEEWVRTAHAGSDVAEEAHYYLGSYLGSTVGPEAGLEVLRQVAAAGGAHAADALWKIGWLERQRGDDAAARAAFEQLVGAAPPGPGYRPAALYWLARLQPDPASERARELYRTVYREVPRDYYARLAAQRLSDLGETPLALPGEGEAIPIDPLDDPARRPEPAYRRAVELRRLGLFELAADELETVTPGADDPGLELALAALHARAGQTWTALEEVPEAVARELAGEPLRSPLVPEAVWHVLYPLPYRDLLVAATARRAPPGEPFDAALVAAVALRESRFWSRAVSPAGAVGLLQLTPATATAVAHQLGAPEPDRVQLFEPAVNLDLGAALLAQLVARFDGVWAPALASYNAGAGVAGDWWQQRRPDEEVDEWIETIPYLETRLYVKKILGDVPNYRLLYDLGPGGGARALAALPAPPARLSARR